MHGAVISVLTGIHINLILDGVLQVVYMDIKESWRDDGALWDTSRTQSREGAYITKSDLLRSAF